MPSTGTCFERRAVPTHPYSANILFIERFCIRAQRENSSTAVNARARTLAHHKIPPSVRNSGNKSSQSCGGGGSLHRTPKTQSRPATQMASIRDEECDETPLEQQLKAFNEMKAERSSLRHRIAGTWKSLRLRSALGHMGLMVSLACYTLIGGLVSIYILCTILQRARARVGGWGAGFYWLLFVSQKQLEHSLCLVCTEREHQSTRATFGAFLPFPVTSFVTFFARHGG